MQEKRDHRISLEYARQLTRNFREFSSGSDIHGGLFDKESVLAVLQQPDCVAMRYYYGIDEYSKSVLVIVGVDKKGNDILNGVIIEKAFPCPPYCGDINALNAEELKEKRMLV
jgi:hypothetical protein